MYGMRHLKNKQNGGMVNGPGTGTSDSIKTEVPAGSYIMPADSTAAIGKETMDAMAGKGFGFPVKKRGPDGVPVNVSSGEYQMAPEQVYGFGMKVLNGMKNATHTPVETKGEGGELYFANGGVVDDPNKPRGFGFRPQTFQDMASRAASTPAVSQPSPLNPGAPEARGFGWPPRGTAGTQPQAEFRGGAPGYPGTPASEYTKSGALDIPLGAARALSGAASIPVAAGRDAIRNVAAYAVGGDPSSLEGGSTRYRDEAVGNFQGGVSQLSSGFDRIRAAGREALGVKPLIDGGSSQGATAATAQAAQPQQATSQPAGQAPQVGGGLGWRRTGIGVGEQGGEIAARIGADGVPEFTNEAATPGAVSNAVGGFPPRGQAPSMPAQEGFGIGPNSRLARSRAGVGSMDNIGNGVGTFSQGAPGDAQLALQRFERANQERARMNEIRREGEGNGGVTGVRDSSRAPTIAEIINERRRMAAERAQLDARRVGTEERRADLEVANSAQRANTELLNQQRLQQEIASGQLSLEGRQRLAQLEAQLADPNLSPDQRRQAEAAYYAMNTPAKDRYMEVRGGTDANGVKAPSQVFDTRTGQYVNAPDPRLPAGVNREQALSEARAAIEAGIPREAVNQRLQQWGLDPV